jgi:tetratricopeptide (TPR) repeat protein
MPSPRRFIGVCFFVALSVLPLACDGGSSNNPDDADPDDDLGDGQLTSKGPGGVGNLIGGDADPKVVEAEAMLADGKYKAALERIDAAIAEKPDIARYHYVRGNALTYLDDDAGAEQAYQRSIELDADDPLPLAALGRVIAFRDGATKADKQRGAELFTAALKLDAELASAHQSLGVVLLALEQYPQAVEALENADRLDGNAETAYLLAQAHGELGNFDKAVTHAASAVEFEPGASGVDLRLLHARLLLQAGQADASAREFEQVAKLVPDSPPLRLEVVRGLLELGKPDAAMVHMQWLLTTLPNEVPVIVNHGRILIAQGKPKDAIARFDEALKLEPGVRAALTYKIEAQVVAKQCKEAKKTFDVLASGLGWEGGKARAAKLEELPRALEKARGYLDPSCK